MKNNSLNKRLSVINVADLKKIGHVFHKGTTAPKKSSDISENNSELINAVKKADSGRIRRLIENGADVNFIDPNGETAILTALRNKNLNIAESLINSGAICDETTLKEALKIGNHKICNMIINNIVNAQSNPSSISADQANQSVLNEANVDENKEEKDNFDDAVNSQDSKIHVPVRGFYSYGTRYSDSETSDDGRRRRVHFEWSTKKLSAEEYYNLGLSKIDEIKYKEAIKDYKLAVKSDPDYVKERDVEFGKKFGYAYYERGCSSDRVSDFDKAIELNPDYYDAYYKRGYLRASNNDHESAMSDYEKAAKCEGERGFHYARGFSKSILGDHKGALIDYRMSIECANKNIAEWKQQVIDKEMSEGDSEDFISSWRVLIDETYYRIGISKAALGQYEEAIEIYDKIIQPCIGRESSGHEEYTSHGYFESDDNDIKCSLLPGRIYYNRAFANFKIAESKELGHYYHEANVYYQKAIDDLNKSIDGFGWDKDEIIIQIKTLNRLRDSMLEIFLKSRMKYSIKNKKLDTELRYNSSEKYEGEIENHENSDRYYEQNYERERNRCKIIKDLDKTIELNPDKKNAYYIRGYFKAVYKHHKKAILDYEEAAKNGCWGSLYYARGFSKSILEDHLGAIVDYNKAIECLKQYTAKWEKDKELQKQFREENIERLSTLIDEAHYRIGLSKAAIGKFKEAIEEYDRIVQSCIDRKLSGKLQYECHLGFEFDDKDIKCNLMPGRIFYNRAKAYIKIAESKKRVSRDYEGASKYYNKAIDDLVESVKPEYGFRFKTEDVQKEINNIIMIRDSLKNPFPGINR